MAFDLEKIAMKVASGKVRTAGRIEFVRDTGPVRRDVRVPNFNWDPKVLRSLTKILWAAERSHSFGISALRLLTKMPASDFSPDGLLGGRGYIQEVKDLRTNLSQAVEIMSAFSDTLHDEINASHWTSLGEDPETAEVMHDVNSIKADPEAFVNNEYKEEVQEDINMNESSMEDFNTYTNPSADEFNPFVENNGNDDDEDDGWGDITSLSTDLKNRLADLKNRLADSSIPLETMPGPRVLHIGPGESPEEGGGYTDHDDRPSDDLMGEGFAQYDRILESPESAGVTGYDNPTDGDESLFKMSGIMRQLSATYSWLPGANNQKIMDYYRPGLSNEDMEWMRANSDPDGPTVPKKPKPHGSIDPLWQSLKD